MTNSLEALPTVPSSVPPSIRRRLLGVLIAGQGISSVAQIVASGTLPIVVVALAHTDAAAGLPATLTLIGRAIAAIPVGWLMDKIGRRFGLSLGFLLCTIGTVLSALAIGWGALFVLLLATLIVGMGRGVSDQARFAAAEVESDDRRAKAIGWVVFASTIGAIGGPILIDPSEQWAARFNIASATGPYYVGALLFYVAFMATALWLRPDPMLVGRAMEAERPQTDDKPIAKARPLPTIFADWNVRLALISITVGQLVMTSIMIITPVYMTKQGYTTGNWSWVLAAHLLGMFGLAGVTGWLIDKSSSKLMISAGALLLALAAIMASLAFNLLTLSLTLFLLGLGWNFCYVAGSSLLSAALRPNERGRVQGASETLVSLASGIGSLSVGALFEYGGIFGISGGSLVFCLVLIVAMLWVARLRPNVVAVGGD
jgi:MFS family permease